MAQHIVCIILDTWRLDYFSRMAERGWSIGVPGKGVRTPNIERFAARCHLFDRFVCGSHPCGPFRRDLWTGRFEFPFRGWGPILTSDRTHARELRTQGFTTFYLTSNTPLVDASFWFERPLEAENPIKGNYHAFFDGWESVRGVVHDYASTDPIPTSLRTEWETRFKQKPLGRQLEMYLRQRQHWQHEEDWPTARLFRRARQWLERNRAHEKTFLMLDCFAPHEMFDPPPYYPALFRAEDGTPHHPHPIYGWAGNLYNSAELETIRADYAGDLAMVDRWLGLFLDQLELMGGMEDTLVVLTSDHGYYLGDHGFIGKPCAFSPVIPLHGCIARAPLLIYDPKTPQKSPRWRSALAQGVDLFATMLDYAGAPLPEGTHGRSLLPVVRDEAPQAREIGLCGNHAGLVQVTDGKQMLLPPESAEFAARWPKQVPIQEKYQNALLYDMENLADDRNLAAERPDAVAELRRRGADYLCAMQAPEKFIQRVSGSAAGIS